MKICSEKECEQEHYARGLCKLHYSKESKRKRKLELTYEICSVEECQGRLLAKGFCEKHYYQMLRRGRILKISPTGPNEFYIDGPVCEIQIYDHQCNHKLRTIIDLEDHDRVKQYRWSLGTNHNILNKTAGLLSRFIMGVTNLSVFVDHINHDRLDNRKENLRVCSRSENNSNKKKYKQNKSGYKGVGWRERSQKWTAAIRVGGKTRHLGYFNTKEGAAQAYNEAAIKYFGEFACLNVIPRKIRRIIMSDSKKIVKIANLMDRYYLRSTFQKLNALEEVKPKVATDFSDTEYLDNLGISFVTKINSLEESVFNRLCDNGQFPKEVEKLYLCLTNQAQPDVYMLSKIQFKKGKAKKSERMKRVETPPEPVVETPVVKETKIEKATKKQEKEIARDEFGIKLGTTSARIAELISKNRFTAQEIADRVSKDLAFVHVVVARIKKTKQWKFFYEIKNGRRVLCCERKE